jgi:hypothetical protein
VVNSAKQALSGGWSDGSSSFPSGSRGAAANFIFSFNVLLGDVTQSNTVNTADVNLVQNDMGGIRGTSFYSIFTDVNGSGSISIVDVSLTQNMVGKTLPAGSPALSAAIRSSASSSQSSIGNLSSAAAAAQFSNNAIGFDSFSQLLNPKDRVEMLL